jgi:hypothetical protein
MAALRVLSNDRSHTFRQSIESTAHIRRFAGHPDPSSLCAIHRLQTWQPHHPAASTTASNTRTCSASNPGLTIRLRPFLSRISTLESSGVLGPCPATCTSRNFVGVSSSSRLFHTKKYGRHKPCSRQNAFTLCPLCACSETSLRHFIQAFFERLVMSQHCIATRIFTRWGSRSAHEGHTLSPIDSVALTAIRPPKTAQNTRVLDPSWTPIGPPGLHDFGSDTPLITLPRLGALRQLHNSTCQSQDRTIALCYEYYSRRATKSRRQVESL